MEQKKVTLKEIAEKTGVSMATVHRAIYGKGGLSEETRKKIMDEVERSNYQLDEAASVLKRSARTVYVVLPKAQDEERFYFKDVWRGIRKEAQRLEPFKIYFKYIESEYPMSKISRELERVYDEDLDEMDGLITVGDSEESCIWINRFAKRGVYAVIVSSYSIMDDPHVSTIKVNHKCCGRLAADFMKYGLRGKQGKILVFCGNNSIYSNHIYADAFETEMKKLGHEICRVEGFGRAEISEEAGRYLDQGGIDGVFICNARNTYSVCRILEDRNTDKDVLVVGTDLYQELGRFFENGILDAVICQYQWEQGEVAVQKMQDYLSRGIRDQEDEVISPVLLLKSNYACFLEEE